MIQIERQALVLYSAEQMYNLVNDVRRYPEFLPGMIATEVLEETDSMMLATMTMGRAGVRVTLKTQNDLVFAQSINMQLKSGPFQHLSGVWQFENLGDLGSKVSLNLTFEPDGAISGKIVGSMMSHLGSQMVNEFSKRATVIYG